MHYPASLLDPARLTVLCDAAREADAMQRPGLLAEFGIMQGGTARAMSEVSPHRRLMVFDTFAGLPTPDPTHDAVLQAGQFCARLPDAAAVLQGLPVTIVVGEFPASAAGLDPLFAVVHLDMDLYTPTVAALAYCWPRMAPGGVIVLDDFTNRETPGIRQAVEAFGAPFEVLGMQATIVKRTNLLLCNSLHASNL